MQDLAVKANPHDFSATHTAMRRWVEGNILAGVSSAVLVGVSYATEAPDPAQLRDLTFGTMTDERWRTLLAQMEKMKQVQLKQ